MSLGKLIRSYRESHNLSIRAFAAKAGLSHQYIINLESGEDPTSGRANRPTIDALQKLAAAMDITLESLVRMAGYSSTDTSPADDPIELDTLLRRADVHLSVGGRELSPEERQDVVQFLKVILKTWERSEPGE